MWRCGTLARNDLKIFPFLTSQFLQLGLTIMEHTKDKTINLKEMTCIHCHTGMTLSHNWKATF
jgi:hypothetical protein